MTRHRVSSIITPVLPDASLKHRNAMPRTLPEQTQSGKVHTPRTRRPHLS